MEEVARQLIRALRGSRSQRELSTALGYSSNPVAEWEGGRRAPNAAELFRISEACGIDTAACLSAFHGPAAHAWSHGDEGAARWLDALRGSLPVKELAERAGVSPRATVRWLKGERRPRLPDFLRLVEAASGRLVDLVALMVDIDEVPSMREGWLVQQSSRQLLVQRPWSAAVLMLIEANADAEDAHTAAGLAAALGIDEQDAAACVAGLIRAGAVERVGDRLRLSGGSLTVDTPEGMRALKAHWTRVAHDRIGQSDEDVYSHNVFGVSEADLARIRALQSAFYREVRAIIAASEPTEVVALLNVQSVTLARAGAGSSAAHRHTHPA